eukprot:167450_1
MKFQLLFVWHILSLTTSQITTIGTTTWIDDFQYDLNGINGWSIYQSTEPPTTKTFYTPPNINFTVQLKQYHGAFNYIDNDITWMQRYFQCSTPSTIEITYEFGSCNTETGDSMKIYVLNDTESHGRNTILKNSNDALGPITDNSLLTFLQNNVYNSSTWISGGVSNFGKIMPDNVSYVASGETFLISFSMELTQPDEYGYINNIEIKCVTTTTTTAEPTLPTISPITNTPTSNPTTANPTINPTNIPTSIPTNIPTYIPTSNPVTYSPTSAPTTDAPTTMYPTISPTITDVAEESVKTTVDNVNKLTTGEDLATILYIIAGVVILLLVV